MGIWSLNKRGEDTATSNVIPVVIGLFVIAILVIIIFAFRDQLMDKSSPLVQDFEEAIDVAQHAVEDPSTQEEATLSQTFELYVNGLDACVDIPGSNCGCGITTTPLPENTYIGVFNDIEDDTLKFVTFSSTDVPKERYSEKSIKLGLIHYDETTDQLKCIFPQSFTIYRSEDQNKNFDITQSQWAISLNGINYYDIVDYFDSNDHFTVETSNPNFIIFNYFNHEPVYFDYFESDNLWRYRTGMQNFHDKNFFYPGWSFPDSANKIYDHLQGKSEEEGIAYFQELQEIRNKLVFDSDMQIFIPNIIKLDDTHYCLATELVAEEDSLGSLTIAETDTILSTEEDIIYYYDEYSYFYLAEKEYCHNLDISQQEGEVIIL